jgi:FkbM family methyltransferase
MLYPLLMGFNYVVYPVLKKGILVKANTCFGVPMLTRLPSGTDIVLNGIKSHDSEIRLTKFLTHQLNEGDTFIDVGAHFGYYSLLASVLVGASGQVYAVEASHDSFELLKINTSGFKHIHLYHNAAGDKPGEVIFYEYPGPYAEYNTTIQDAYLDQPWARKVKQTVNRVKTLVLDDLMHQSNISKAIIKIDAEGGELSVLSGLTKAMDLADLTIVMEYLTSAEPDSPHKQAVALLEKHGYHPYFITSEVALGAVTDTEEYLNRIGLDSDNLVFRKT